MDKQKAKEKRMNTENLKSQMRKGVLEYCTLLLLSRKRAYTSDIISELKKAHLIVVEGNEWEESTQGPPRKYYVITPVGEAFLSELEDTWNGLNKTVNHLKEL